MLLLMNQKLRLANRPPIQLLRRCLKRSAVLKCTCIFSFFLCLQAGAVGVAEEKKPAPEIRTATPPTFKGIVKDAGGNPLVGATVAVKGAKQITQTDANGAFTIELPSDDAVLVISYVGFETMEFRPGNQTDITIALKAVPVQMNDVVIVGYGTQRKANLTGAVDQVNSEVLENRSIANLNQGLQGVLPNLNIRLADGKPNQSPKFNIRGTTSIGQGGNALVLIDGVEGDPSLINPNDVATVTILKDAASASIYGARGAFGVVLISTKNPSRGKTSITYTANHSFKSPITLPDFVNDGYTFAKLFAESSVAWDGQFPQAVNKTLKFSQAYLAELQRRQGLGLPEVEVDPVTGEYVYYGSTDWYDLLYKDHNDANEHNLTVSGGSDKATFMITGRYFSQEGLFHYNPDDYRMLNFRAKGAVQVFPWLRIDNNMDISNVNYHNPLNVGEGGGIWRNIADEGHPLAPLFNPDGSLTFSAAYTVGDFVYGKNGFDQEKGIIRNRTAFTAEFFQNTFRLKGDITYQSTENNETRKQVPVPYSNKPGVISYVGTTTNDLREISQKTQYIATNIYGEYEKIFNLDHYVKFLAGYNYEQSTFKSMSAQRNGLIFDDANDLNLALGGNISTAGGFEEWAILGGFGRLNYAFRNKYLLEVNGRYDGSSKFPTNQRYGFFPSVSAGWRVSKEGFWHVSPKVLTDLKIRASYGSLGNGNVASYSYLEQFSVSQSALILNGQRPQQTSRPSVLPSGLTWETSTTTNVGLDLTFLSGRLQFVGDAYVRNTTDMFTVGVTLPAVFGATPPRGNYADLRTKGWEMTLGWNDKFGAGRKPFNYDVRLTLADNTAVITKYNNPTRSLTDYYEGMKIGEIWGYVTEGFFATADEIAKHADQKLFLSTSSGAIYPGDIKLKDLSGDGVINQGLNTADNHGDRAVIGNSAPRYMYSANLGAEWNNIFFSAFFQGVGKQEWFPSTEASVFWGQYNRPYNKIPSWQLNNHWTPENPNALLPRYVSRLANRAGGILREAQTRYIFNVAYIRLKNIQVGYNLPKSLVQKIHSTNARVYVSAENIWTYSPLFKVTKDIDPENTGPSDQFISTTNQGDAYNYPMLKGITIGLSITF
jgi:TonB-linked SusC/RagA family outer membrane protein